MNIRLLAFGLSLALLQGCTSPKVAPRFNKPSTAAITSSHRAAAASVASAQKRAVKLDQEKVIVQDPALKLQVDALSSDLDTALQQLQLSEGETKQLDQQLGKQTDQANQLADSYDRAQLKIEAVQQSRHRWVRYFWISTGLLALASLWILRRPLLLLAAGGGL